MDIVVERCCGLDVHKDTVVACVRTPGKGGKREVQTSADGAMRKKIPQLRLALEGRFSTHHALIVGQILAKLDFLDEAIGTLSSEIDRVIAPFEAEVALLDTIPGVDRRRRRVPHRRDRDRHGPLRNLGSPCQLGRDVPGEP
jgi:hypothetical protein